MGSMTTGELVDEFYRARRDKDTAALVALLAPDAEWIKPASLPVTRTVGAEAIARGLSGSNFDPDQPFTIDVRRVIVDGDVAVVQHTVSATVKATGAPYENEYCWIYDFADGRLVRLEEYADTLLAYRSMNWLFDAGPTPSPRG